MAGPGRPKGSPNKATIEQAEIAKRQVEGAKVSGRKLGKELLDDFAHLFAGMAAAYQPAPPGQPPRPNQNEEKFLTYGKLAVETAKDLAKFQSPTFRAIALSADPTRPAVPQIPGPTTKVSPMEAFRLMRDGDVIDAEFEEVVPAKKPRRA